MLLLIDAGNTHIVFAIHDGTDWRGMWRMSMSAQRTTDEYGVWLLSLLKAHHIDRLKVRGAVIGTVVPQALGALSGLCRQYFDVDPLIASVSLDWGFSIDVDIPAEVGADRLLNALAAYHRFRQALVVIDFGTATTFDVVDTHGNYCGGVIAPGVSLSLSALHQAAAQLPRIGFSYPGREHIVGRNTTQAMQSGVFWGYVGLMEGIVARIRRQCKENFKIVATGGFASAFAQGTDLIEDVDPMLTLRGLYLLACRNSLPRKK